MIGWQVENGGPALANHDHEYMVPDMVPGSLVPPYAYRGSSL